MNAAKCVSRVLRWAWLTGGRALNTVGACTVLIAMSFLVRADEPAAASAEWTDTFVTRIEALALLRTLDVELLTQDSATLTLEHWCDVHRLASPARIIAVRDVSVDKTPSAEQRRELNVTPAEPVRYRRVKLFCGTRVLSEADNWYVPGRLTAAMNQLLETDMPFGKVVHALDFHRRTLSARLLWMPLPEGWEMAAHAAAEHSTTLRVPAQVLQHRALLSLPDGTPFSEVVETYTGDVLSFPMPKP